MKRALLILILCATTVAGADDSKKSEPVHVVQLSPELITAYTSAQQRTAGARQALEATPAYKDLLIAQSQQESTLLYIMSETGSKASECKAVFDEKTGKLTHLECKGAKP